MVALSKMIGGSLAGVIGGNGRARRGVTSTCSGYIRSSKRLAGLNVDKVVTFGGLELAAEDLAAYLEAFPDVDKAFRDYLRGDLCDHDRAQRDHANAMDGYRRACAEHAEELTRDIAALRRQDTTSSNDAIRARAEASLGPAPRRPTRPAAAPQFAAACRQYAIGATGLTTLSILQERSVMTASAPASNPTVLDGFDDVAYDRGVLGVEVWLPLPRPVQIAADDPADAPTSYTWFMTDSTDGFKLAADGDGTDEYEVPNPVLIGLQEDDRIPMLATRHIAGALTSPQESGESDADLRRRCLEVDPAMGAAFDTNQRSVTLVSGSDPQRAAFQLIVDGLADVLADEIQPQALADYIYEWGNRTLGVLTPAQRFEAPRLMYLSEVVRELLADQDNIPPDLRRPAGAVGPRGAPAFLGGETGAAAVVASAADPVFEAFTMFNRFYLQAALPDLGAEVIVSPSDDDARTAAGGEGAITRGIGERVPRIVVSPVASVALYRSFGEDLVCAAWDAGVAASMAELCELLPFVMMGNSAKAVLTALRSTWLSAPAQPMWDSADVHVYQIGGLQVGNRVWLEEDVGGLPRWRRHLPNLSGTAVKDWLGPQYLNAGRGRIPYEAFWRADEVAIVADSIEVPPDVYVMFGLKTDESAADAKWRRSMATFMRGTKRAQVDDARARFADAQGFAGSGLALCAYHMQRASNHLWRTDRKQNPVVKAWEATVRSCNLPGGDVGGKVWNWHHDAFHKCRIVRGLIHTLFGGPDTIGSVFSEAFLSRYPFTASGMGALYGGKGLVDDLVPMAEVRPGARSLLADLRSIKSNGEFLIGIIEADGARFETESTAIESSRRDAMRAYGPVLGYLVGVAQGFKMPADSFSLQSDSVKAAARRHAPQAAAGKAAAEAAGDVDEDLGRKQATQSMREAMAGFSSLLEATGLAVKVDNALERARGIPRYEDILMPRTALGEADTRHPGAGGLSLKDRVLGGAHTAESLWAAETARLARVAGDGAAAGPRHLTAAALRGHLGGGGLLGGGGDGGQGGGGVGGNDDASGLA